MAPATLLTLPAETLGHIASFLPAPSRTEYVYGTALDFVFCCRALLDVGLRTVYRDTKVPAKEHWLDLCAAVSSRPAIANWVVSLELYWADPCLPAPGHPILPCCRSLAYHPTESFAWDAGPSTFCGPARDHHSIAFGLALAAAVCPNVCQVSMALVDPNAIFRGRPACPPSLDWLSLLGSRGVLDLGNQIAYCRASLRHLFVSAYDAIALSGVLLLGPTCPGLEKLDLVVSNGFVPLREEDRGSQQSSFPSLAMLRIYSSDDPSELLLMGSFPKLKRFSLTQLTSNRVIEAGSISANMTASLHKNEAAFPSLASIDICLYRSSGVSPWHIRGLRNLARQRRIRFELTLDDLGRRDASRYLAHAPEFDRPPSPEPEDEEAGSGDGEDEEDDAEDEEEEE